MNKHNFKVGDKVKLKDPRQFSVGARILTIIDWDCGDKYIPVWYKGMQWPYFPLKPCEIEFAVKVGEQLLFEFMKED